MYDTDLKEPFLFQALLEFLQRVVDNKEKNKMTVMNVAMVMAPNLFMYHSFNPYSNFMNLQLKYLRHHI